MAGEDEDIAEAAEAMIYPGIFVFLFLLKISCLSWDDYGYIL